MANLRFQFDVVVVGAGPAGIAAACLAAESGRRVAMLDNTPWLGGQIWRGQPREAGRGNASGPSQGNTSQGQEHASAPRLARKWLQRLRSQGIQLLPSATAFAAPAPGTLLVETALETLEIGWRQLVLATGARELFLPFPGWTLPGILGPGGLHALAKSGWPVDNKRVVVAGSGPLLLAAADSLKHHGAQISLVAEQADWRKVIRLGLQLLPYPAKLIQGIGITARLLGVPYRCGCWPIKADGASRIERVTLTDGNRSWTQDCDYLACGFHLVPNLELPQLLGCALEKGFVRVDEFQRTSIPDVFCAGELTGIGGADCSLVEGQIAGLAAAEKEELARTLFRSRNSWHRFRTLLREAFALRPELRRLAAPDTIVCRCEDVRLAQLSGSESWRAAKLHTRCGMGSCQGRTCGGAVQFLFGWENDSVRPPLFPVPLVSLTNRPSPLDKYTLETNNSS